MGDSATRPCPLCRGRDIDPSPFPPTIFNGSCFRYVTCRACGCVFVTPRPSDDDIAKMYPPSYQEEHYFISEEHRSDVFEALEGWIRNDQRKLLDFGCGDARFVRFAARRGWDCTGAEYHPAHVTKLSKIMPEARFLAVDDVLSSSSSQSFDVIHLADVFEHLREPIDTLNQLIRLLAPGALLFVEGPIELQPTLTGVLMRQYFRWRGQRPGSHAPTHLVFTDAGIQHRVFKDLGFETILFELDEEARPFPERWQDARGQRGALKYVIGRVSKTVSRWVPGLGNRFRYIGRLRSP